MLNLATKWLSWQRCSTVCSNVCHGLFRFTVITVNVAKYFTYEHKSASAWCIIISNMVMFSYSYSIFIRTCSFIVLLHYIQITVLFTHVLGYSHIHNSSLFHLYSYSTDVVYMLKGCLHRMLELILCRIFFICKSLLQSDIWRLQALLFLLKVCKTSFLSDFYLLLSTWPSPELNSPYCKYLTTQIMEKNIWHFID